MLRAATDIKTAAKGLSSGRDAQILIVCLLTAVNLMSHRTVSAISGDYSNDLGRFSCLLYELRAVARGRRSFGGTASDTEAPNAPLCRTPSCTKNAMQALSNLLAISLPPAHLQCARPHAAHPLPTRRAHALWAAIKSPNA